MMVILIWMELLTTVSVTALVNEAQVTVVEVDKNKYYIIHLCKCFSDISTAAFGELSCPKFSGVSKTMTGVISGQHMTGQQSRL